MTQNSHAVEQIDATDTLQIRSHRRAQWFWIDNDVIDVHAQALGPIGVALYAALARYTNHKTGQCYPSLVLLSTKLGMTHLTARRYLHRLVERRLITVEPRPGHSALITLLDMPETDAPRQETTGSLPRNEVQEQGSYDVPGDSYQVTTPLLPGNDEPDLQNQKKERTSAPPENVCDMQTKTLQEASTISSPLTPPERPDDVLNRLDAATRASLDAPARAAMTAAGVKPDFQTIPVVESYQVAVWYQQQAHLNAGVAAAGAGRAPEEGPAPRATRAA